MRALSTLFTIIMLVVLSAGASCTRTSSAASNCTAVRISLPGISQSHNNGSQCASCHIFQGVGPGCFTLAGSVYTANSIDPYTTGQVRLYTQQNAQGILKGTYYIDAKGNFYTTAKIDWGAGLYASMYDANGNAKHMQGITNDGNCNRCHGEASERLVLP